MQSYVTHAHRGMRIKIISKEMCDNVQNELKIIENLREKSPMLLGTDSMKTQSLSSFSGQSFEHVQVPDHPRERMKMFTVQQRCLL